MPADTAEVTSSSEFPVQLAYSLHYNLSLFFRWKQDGGLDDYFHRGQPSNFMIKFSEYMERRLEDNDETTSVELQRLIAQELRVMTSSVHLLSKNSIYRGWRASGLR